MMVQGFCPQKINISQFPDGFRLIKIVEFFFSFSDEYKPFLSQN